MWKILGGRQPEPAEADLLLRDRTTGPLEGVRSKMGRPFTASLKLNDANEIAFDFGNDDADGDDAPDFSAQEPLGPCPKCASRVFEHGNVYVCEKAIGSEKTCDFRSGRTILQRPVERAQMQKLLATGKTDLLQFVSARTRRPFSAFLARQPDGKIGFEFAPRPEGAKGRGRPAAAGALRVLGKHPRDGKAVELYSGRYGPYVKHGEVNATLPDKDQQDTLTLEDAVALVDAKAGRSTPAKKAPGKAAKTAATKAAAKKATAKAPAAETPAPKTARTAKKTAVKSRAATAAGPEAPAAKAPAAKAPAAKTAATKTAATTTAKTAAPTAAKKTGPAARKPAAKAAKKTTKK
jgi:DNA topoisomerase-3